MRPSNRKTNQMREVTIETGVNAYAEGSCLISFGNTKVLCTATAEGMLPRWLKGKGHGWVTAEYGMLPRSTHQRMDREAAKGKQSGRTQEIQRLIGRSLRAVCDLEALGERAIWLDCDVIQADGGTRTTSITGAYVALYLALQKLVDAGEIAKMPLKEGLAAISCGITEAGAVCDLDYAEDSTAIADGNFVMTESGKVVEIQTTAEDYPLEKAQFLELTDLAEEAIKQLTEIQKQAIAKAIEEQKVA